ncbi:myo-inositol monophosphatase like 2 [Raphanus sativus]|uniref:histidinol-phosphatase n=1 Tax=Raphanus sativus TaxID=3726 RepID=A0A6J0LW91_RAPSA|nr:bifunctional phosphatase IMPL2, chloroplastic [Raphanus sativus]XP_056848467.1 bifunctional phosphatase IMPL2, chloroplastic [Raphanus sativus]KAJ4880081.1 myo-inositol monophosphatase like 2 [Raphanus sativus]
MLAQSHFLCKSFSLIPPPSPVVLRSATRSLRLSSSNSSRLSFPSSSLSAAVSISRGQISLAMASNSKRTDARDDSSSEPIATDLDRFAAVANELADASGEVIRKYFRKKFDIVEKDDMSPVTIADQMAEEAMVSIIFHNFPSHAIYGEEKGWRCKEESADYVWVLDPIDGTKSFITGKPVFGTLIALLYKGKPILGLIDQPILKERWIGMSGRRTKLNGENISTRSCPKLSQAYLYTTSPHLFAGEAEKAFARVRDKVKMPLYGCDCYAYALLASGFVDLVIESGLKPYDFLALVPVIEGAGGTITDWNGNPPLWEASSSAVATSFNVVAAGDSDIHQQALESLEWH